MISDNIYKVFFQIKKEIFIKIFFLMKKGSSKVKGYPNVTLYVKIKMRE